MVQFVDGADLALLAGLPLLTAFSWCLPERVWWPLSRTLTKAIIRIRRRETRSREQKIKQIVGDQGIALSPGETYTEYLAERLQWVFQTLRVHRPGSWHGDTRLVGKEHLNAAIEDGNGAILWLGNFVHNPLVTAMALGQAGFEMSHLSRWDHGISSTRLGNLFINPIWTRAEERFMSERLVIGADDRVKALKALHQRLDCNRIVSIAANHIGERTASLPFLAGHIRLALGAPKLALSTGANLLPVFTLRRDSGYFEVTIQPPIESPSNGSREDVLLSMLTCYVKRLEACVIEHPAQWSGWFYLAHPKEYL